MIGRSVYRLLLRLYPERVRRDSAEEILRLFDELRADARRRGRLAALGFTLRAYAELPRRAFEMRPHNQPPTDPTRPGSPGIMIDRLSHEMRHAVRALRFNPGFAAVVVLTLAVGIGANTAIFSLVKGVLLDALPYAEPERVVGVWQYNLETGGRARMTPGNFVGVRALDEVFDSAAAFGSSSATLLLESEPVPLNGGQVSAAYLDVLGVQPLLGRGFRADDEEVGGPAVTLVSEELWRTRLGADPGIVGATVNFDGEPFEIIGVLPRGLYPTAASVDGEIPFTPDNHDFLVPIRWSAQIYDNRRSHVLGVVARLADGVTVAQADAAVDALAAAVREQYPIVAGEGFRASLLRDEIVGGSRAGLLVLMGTVAVVLLIAATNVAGLMLARADARRGETAVRAALGAGRWTLVRCGLWESLLLTGVGTAAGVALAYAGLDAIKGLVPFQIPRINDVAIDGAALSFAVVTALAVGAVLGTIPSLLATRERALASVRQGARSVTADGRRRRAQGLLVAAQACMAVLLVVGAGLLVRTFVSIQRIDPGFSAGGALAVPLSLPQSRYPGPQETLRFLQEIEESLTARPEVQSVAFGYDHPLSKRWGDGFLIEGAPPLAPEQSQGASFRMVTPGYFETVGIPLLQGRTLQATDDADHPLVAIVNDAFAQRYFPATAAVGKRIRIPTAERIAGSESEEWIEIVGVVGNVRFNGPTAAIEPAMYVSTPQVPMGFGVLLVAPARPGIDLYAVIRRAVHAIDPELPVAEPRTLDTIFADAIARQRFNMLLVGLFATLALTLAGLGIYGLIARLVQSQVREIGIRLALGARRAQILEVVLWGALTPVLIGGLAGLLGAAGLSRMLDSLLYGVGALDPVTFLATPVVLLGTAVLAAWLPARRATRIDPISALRQE